MKKHIWIIFSFLWIYTTAQQTAVFAKRNNPQHQVTFYLPAQVKIKTKAGKKYHALYIGQHDSIILFRPANYARLRDTEVRRKLREMASDFSLTQKRRTEIMNTLVYPDTLQLAFSSIKYIRFDISAKKHRILNGILYAGALLATNFTVVYEVVTHPQMSKAVQISLFPILMACDYIIYRCAITFITPEKWNILH